jgi:hypothetical protein
LPLTHFRLRCSRQDLVARRFVLVHTNHDPGRRRGGGAPVAKLGRFAAQTGRNTAHDVDSARESEATMPIATDITCSRLAPKRRAWELGACGRQARVHKNPSRSPGPLAANDTVAMLACRRHADNPPLIGAPKRLAGRKFSDARSTYSFLLRWSRCTDVLYPPVTGCRTHNLLYKRHNLARTEVCGGPCNQ